MRRMNARSVSMAPQGERWRRLQDLFAAAAAVPSDEREPWLAQACAGDDELHRELASLLAAAHRAVRFLEEPIVHLAPLEEAQEQELSEEDGLLSGGDAVRVGPWQLLERIGRGGMGTVYRARRDDDVYQQEVAVKILRRGLDTEDLVSRFRRERQILAQLEHPSIARLIDGGATDDGRPYLVMEHVDGTSIDRFCDEHRLDLASRLHLFRRVCAAVAFAHQNLVVHRDLKPANILVTGKGEPKLLDFGVAKLLEDEAASWEAAPTFSRPAPLTPRYASPEQQRGGVITTASDVYSLGVVLYELLTGVSPFPAASDAGAPPPRASDAAASVPAEVAARRREAPQGLSRRLRGDLDSLLLTALEPERERRYPSAEALGEEIDRFLGGHPLVARGHRFADRCFKFLKRHRIAAGASAAALAVLVAFLLTLLAQRRQVLAQQGRAEEVSDFLVDLFALPDPTRSRGESVTARELLDRGAGRIPAALASQPAAAAELARTMGHSYRNLGLLAEAEPLLDRAVELARLAHGDGHPRVAAALQERADLAATRGQLERAERLTLEALSIRRRNRSGQSGDVVESLTRLARVQALDGRLDDARSSYEEALRLARELGDGARLAAVQQRFGGLLARLGDDGTAEAMVREAVAILIGLHGPLHPEVALARNDLALLVREHDAEVALALLREAEAGQRQLFSDPHPDLATTLHNLGWVLADLGRYDEAQSALQSSLALAKRVYLGEHPRIARTLTLLARVAFDRGRLDEAISLDREALAMAERVLDDDHLDLAEIRSSLGRALASHGELAEAEGLFRRALGTYRRQLGERGEPVASTLNNLADIAQTRGDLVAAELLYAEALDVLRAIGDDSPRLAAVLHNLASLLRARGDRAGARQHLEQALALTLRLRGPGHIEVARIQVSLARLELELGRRERAVELAREALATFEPLLPEDDPWKVATRRVLEQSSRSPEVRE